jgi:TATA-binding protein-associated factor Taf7
MRSVEAIIARTRGGTASASKPSLYGARAASLKPALRVVAEMDAQNEEAELADDHEDEAGAVGEATNAAADGDGNGDGEQMVPVDLFRASSPQALAMARSATDQDHSEDEAAEENEDDDDDAENAARVHSTATNKQSAMASGFAGVLTPTSRQQGTSNPLAKQFDAALKSPRSVTRSGRRSRTSGQAVSSSHAPSSSSSSSGGRGFAPFNGRL